MKTTYIILLVIVASCNPPVANKHVDVSISILFNDSEGVNILLKDNPDFTLDDLNLYYYDKEMQYVNGFTGYWEHTNPIAGLVEDGKVKMWPVFGEEDGTYLEGGKSTTYLDFGNGDIDTIQVSGIKSRSQSVIKDVWYNGEYMDDAMLKGFAIIK